MPFTANRQFKKAPRLLARAEGMYYWTPEGRQVLDGTAGLWCVNAGHCRPKIVEAVQQPGRRDGLRADLPDGPPGRLRVRRAPGARSRRRASRACSSPTRAPSRPTPRSRSRSPTTARAARPARYPPDRPRARLPRRQFRRHGGRRHHRQQEDLRPGRRRRRPHPPHPRSWRGMRFQEANPQHGAEFADELERLCALHDPSTIAAVIVEPVAGSAGVLVPPVGYLERLREICTRHGILLIFDEVITGFGRLGKPFGSQRFGVMPDLFTTAKGLTNAHRADGRGVREGLDLRGVHAGRREGIELFHGYTYSGHPLACAAGIAHAGHLRGGRAAHARRERSRSTGRTRAHALKGAPHVIDIRNCGLMAAIELEPRAGAARQARLRGVRQGVRGRRADPRHRRHHRAVAAADRRESRRSTRFSIAWERCCAR